MKKTRSGPFIIWIHFNASDQAFMNVVGLMSGTSADGIDAALVQIAGPRSRLKIQLLGFETFPYPSGLQKRLLRTALNGSVGEVCHLNFYVGELFAQAVQRLLKKCRYSPQAVGLIGSHGQTLHHLPQGRREGLRTIRSTLQIGEPSVIAEKTGIATVADFRPRDMAAGGEGAPLTPYFHQTLFRSSKKDRLIVNIGGIGNVTYLPSMESRKRTLAFDVGPGNMLLDGFMVHFTRGKKTRDQNGRLARKGRVDPRLLKWMARHPFLRKTPPKSCGRELFGASFLGRVIQKSKQLGLSNEEVIATLTRFSAHCIGTCLKWLPQKGKALQEIIVGGGGVYNQTLMDLLRQEFFPLPVKTFEDVGFNSRAIEAMAFALLAYTTWKGIPNNLISVTGADKKVSMGKIIPV